MDTSLDITRALKVSIRGLPKDWRLPPGVLVIPSYAPWKQISNLLTLASAQRGNTLRIKNTGSTSWKPLCSSLGLARDDDDEGAD